MACAVVLLIDDGENGSLALIAILVAIGLIFFDPRKLTRGIEEVKLGPVAAKWSATAQVVADQVVTDEGGAGGAGEALKGTSLIDLRLQLEGKLTYLAKHQLAEAGNPTFLSIGSLKIDGGLTAEQADLADFVMTHTDADLTLIPEANRREIERDAGRLVANFRATVHYNLVSSTVHSLAEDEKWSVATLVAEGGKRPHIRLERGDRRSFRIAPVYALSGDSKNLVSARKRLARARGLPPTVDKTIVVIPDNSRAEKAPGDHFDLVKLSQLRAALKDV